MSPVQNATQAAKRRHDILFLRPADDRIATCGFAEVLMAQKMSNHRDSLISAGLPQRYAVIGEVARGGMGVVLRVTDMNLDRPLAVKVLHAKFRNDPDANARLDREALLTGSLQHPGVPPVYERGELIDGSRFFSMKLIEGQTLRELMEAPGYQPGSPRLLDIFRDICQTLAYAHSRAVIHRDLKPANVMVGAWGEVQVMDWGMARHLDDPRDAIDAEASTALFDAETLLREIEEGEIREEADFRRAKGDNRSDGGGSSGTRRRRSEPTLTAVGQVLGTIGYMAPEQARGDHATVDRRSDVFGLGGILCVILTGQPPFVGEFAERFRQAHAGDLSEAYERLEKCDADPELVKLCKQLLAAEPASRPADAAAVAERITGYQDGVRRRLEEERLARAEAEVRAAEEKKRRRVWLGLGAVTAVLLVALAGGAWWYQQHQVEQRIEARVRSERSRVEIEQSLIQASDARARYQFGVSASLLGFAAARLPDVNDDALTLTVTEARRELQFIRSVDDIRLRTATWTNEGFDNTFAIGIDGAFASAFREYGIDIAAGDVDSITRSIASSGIAGDLVQGLDAWWGVEPNVELRTRLYRVAQAVDPQAAREALSESDPEQLKRLANGIDAASLSPMLAANMGLRLSEHAGEIEAAAAILTTASLSHPGDFWLHFYAGQTFAESESAEAQQKAMGHYRAALAIRPENTAAHTNLGSRFSDLGQNELAERSYRTALRLDPQHAFARYNFGRLLADLHRLEEAEAEYRQAIRLDPEYAAAHYNLGSLLDNLDRREQAEDEYREAMRLDPEYAEAHCNLGLLLMRSTDRYSEAAELLRRGHELGTARPDWPYPSKLWLAAAEQLARQDDQFQALIAGEIEPKTGGEALAAANFALVRMSRPLAAARLFETGLADPEVEETSKAEFHYNAACAALLSSAGTSDAADLADDERARWRGLAFEWLTADLARLDAHATDDEPDNDQAVIDTLRHWQTDPDLAPIRGDAVTELPSGEQPAWQALWSDHARILELAETR